MQAKRARSSPRIATASSASCVGDAVCGHTPIGGYDQGPVRPPFLGAIGEGVGSFPIEPPSARTPRVHSLRELSPLKVSEICPKIRFLGGGGPPDTDSD